MLLLNVGSDTFVSIKKGLCLDTFTHKNFTQVNTRQFHMYMEVIVLHRVII